MALEAVATFLVAGTLGPRAHHHPSNPQSRGGNIEQLNWAATIDIGPLRLGNTVGVVIFYLAISLALARCRRFETFY